MSRRANLKVASYPHSQTSPWCIEGLRVGGKRKRLFFTTKTAAEQELNRIKVKQRREGIDALSLPDSLRIVALEGEKKLQARGKTLADAIAFYLQHLEDSERSITVEQLVSEFMADQVRLKHSAVHQRDLRARLERFRDSFGKEKVRCITTKQIQDWLDTLKFASATRNIYRNRLSFLFNFAIRHSYLERNPIEAIGSIKVLDEPISIFSVDAVQGLLNAAPFELIPMLALGAFAGVRSAELHRLDWSDIDLRRGLITVEKAKSKTQRRRVIVMEPVLKAWLAPYSGQTGPIWSSLKRYHTETLELSQSTKIAWKKNGLRHSFASYHYSKYRSADKTSADMGNTPTMVFKHYRELVTPEEAERYFNIFPPAPAENIVSIAA
jgi:integrase